MAVAFSSNQSRFLRLVVPRTDCAVSRIAVQELFHIVLRDSVGAFGSRRVATSGSWVREV